MQLNHDMIYKNDRLLCWDSDSPAFKVQDQNAPGRWKSPAWDRTRCPQEAERRPARLRRAAPFGQAGASLKLASPLADVARGLCRLYFHYSKDLIIFNKLGLNFKKKMKTLPHCVLI